MLNYPEFASLARAHGEPVAKGQLRVAPEDFKVIEIPSFEPTGEGEHSLIKIRKTNLNTAHVAEILAKHANLPVHKVSWAGLKDKNAVTEQWFGVHLAGQKDPDWQSLNTEQLQILDVTRHQRKLKTGALKGNHFEINIQNLEGNREAIIQRLEIVKAEGFPNYFGEQRFGHNANNLAQAQLMFENPKRRVKRHQRSLYLSATRSFLFNAILHQRVLDKTWDKGLEDEYYMLNGSHSLFQSPRNFDIDQRLKSGDIHPTGALYGDYKGDDEMGCYHIEADILDRHKVLTDGLRRTGIKPSRRSLRAIPGDLEYDLHQTKLTMRFSLFSGEYATQCIRELALTSS